MESGVQCRIHKGSPISRILGRINSIPPNDTYFFMLHSNPSYAQTFLKISFLLVSLLNYKSTPTFFHSGYMICHLNLSHFQPSWTQIFALGLCFQIPLVYISPLISENIFHNHITTFNIIVLFLIKHRLRKTL